MEAHPPAPSREIHHRVSSELRVALAEVLACAEPGSTGTRARSGSQKKNGRCEVWWSKCQRRFGVSDSIARAKPTGWAAAPRPVAASRAAR